MIVINFKNYKTGKDVLAFAKKISDPCVIAAVPTLNLKEVAKETRLIVYAQHTDLVNTKRDTGYLTPYSLKDAGVTGTLLNHSEHKLSFKNLQKTVSECHKQKLKVIICASSVTEAKKIKKLNPFAIAYEEPKLIATKKSITNYPLKILKFVKILEKTKTFPLCGAGINKKQDVEAAIELGCKGVLISSAILKSHNPKGFLNKINI